jgi:diguanylate cyclase (GGDEF)-like protein
LPDLVYRDFVVMLFSMKPQVIGMGVVLVGVASLIAEECNDLVAAALAIVTILVTAARVLTINAYLRKGSSATMAELKRLERDYAAGTYAMGALLGALNVRALSYDLPLFHLITVSLLFSYGAGLVCRVSVRPMLCAVGLLLATVPTVAALAAHAILDTVTLHAQLLGIEAVLVALITGLSLQTVVYLYRSAVEHHTAKHDLAQLAKYDALTGLANRLMLRERFQASSERAHQRRSRLALHYLDLDGFKAVNDVHGHPAGDALLQQVSRRLEETVRSDDTVARLGGDEFVVLQTNVSEDGEAELLARRIIKKLSAPYEIDGQTMQISASVGIAMMPEAGRDLERLLAQADAALYRSKKAGKSRASFSTPEDAENERKAA